MRPPGPRPPKIRQRYCFDPFCFESASAARFAHCGETMAARLHPAGCDLGGLVPVYAAGCARVWGDPYSRPAGSGCCAVFAATAHPQRPLAGLAPALAHDVFCGFAQFSDSLACFAFAILSITTGLSSILNATVPMFGALIAWVWLKDRPNGLRILGLGIGFLGIVLLAMGKASFKPDASGSSSGLAIIACLFACLFYGIAANFTKRFLTGVPPLVTATGSQCGAALSLALPMVWLWPAQTPGINAWLAISVLGVLCTGIAYVLYFRLIANAGPARALTVTFMIPVFAVFYGVLFLSEAVTLWMTVCGVIIICGTSLASGLVKWPGKHR